MRDLVHTQVRNEFQRRRDGNKNNIFAFEGGGAGGQRGKLSTNAVSYFFRGKRHNNKFLKMQILLSRNFVVIAQVPRVSSDKAIIINRLGEIVPGTELVGLKIVIALGDRDFYPGGDGICVSPWITVR